MEILYIGSDFSGGKSGGNIVRKNNHDILKKIFKDKMHSYLFNINRDKKKILKNYLLLQFNGQTKEMEREIFKKIKGNNIDVIFFDGSFYGNLSEKIKKKYKNIKIITFFHNIEKNYYRDRLKIENKFFMIVYLSVVYNEKLAIKSSDEIILLNEREEKELVKNYKNILGNKKINIIPIFMKDKYDEKIKLQKCDYDYLFIGSYFFANVQGISWFVEEVLPNIKGKLLVIGNEMEKLKKVFRDTEKLEIKGTVESLDKYYYEDNIIVSPIFLGSGMKTKTIEALMYNKTIVGTKEAFIGISDIDSVGYECNTKEEYIEILTKEIEKKNSRELFLANFSLEIVEKKYRKIMGEI
ncbi:glycosyltransferase family 4 protein [Fusobacterium sp. MFO224]|uniref:glycosyltransferase family 4 protein n=1 Tax=Fusobacterium sp. MFO224 TaxID=3378070 RepID=UPI003853A1E9